MPEGPELHLASRFINSVAKNRFFTGKVEKSAVSKNPEIPWDVSRYCLKAESRGKEIKVHLTENIADSATSKSLSILIRFGMSGCFKFTALSELPKHAHMRFHAEATSEEEPMVLSFVDFRRFGRWEVNGDWSADRGPCPITDYEKFRANVVTSLENAAFSKPICEVLLNQKYFNGIGNYLRAEILHRAAIPPFEEARKALLLWKDAPLYPNIKPEPGAPEDPIYLCHKLAMEVLELDGGKGYDVDHDPENEAAFLTWLKCYQNPTMSNLVDSHGRTIWFSGSPGPLAPKQAKSRRATPSKRTPKKDDTLEATEEVSKTKIKKLDLDSRGIVVKVVKEEVQVNSKQTTRIRKTKVQQSNSLVEPPRLESAGSLRAARAARRAGLTAHTEG